MFKKNKPKSQQNLQIATSKPLNVETADVYSIKKLRNWKTSYFFHFFKPYLNLKKHLQNSSLEILEIFRFWSLEIWKKQILKPQILKPWNLKKSDFEASTSKKKTEFDALNSGKIRFWRLKISKIRLWSLEIWKTQIWSLKILKNQNLQP